MLFDLASDLHLEFGGIPELIEGWVPGASVCVLAGDIVPVELLKSKRARGRDAREFLQYISSKYDRILWVFGNHEYYGNSLNYAKNNAKHIMQKLCVHNIEILDNNTVEVDDALFFGTTLWTDFSKRNPLVMQAVERGMNDYHQIKVNDSLYGTHKGERKIFADDILHLHDRAVVKLTEFVNLADTTTKVLITHHAPSMLSIPERYVGHHLAPGYATELFDLIHDSNIRVAVHGHIHDPVEYRIGNNCTVASNPKGYHGSADMNTEWSVMTIDTNLGKRA